MGGAVVGGGGGLIERRLYLRRWIVVCIGMLGCGHNIGLKATPFLDYHQLKLAHCVKDYRSNSLFRKKTKTI